MVSWTARCPACGDDDTEQEFGEVCDDAGYAAEGWWCRSCGDSWIEERHGDFDDFDLPKSAGERSDGPLAASSPFEWFVERGEEPEEDPDEAGDESPDELPDELPDEYVG
jgi:hypothetical protein